MHKSSYEEMKKFRDGYLLHKAHLDILDVGSMDVNGSYRELFDGWNYTGLDIESGPNVGVVATSPYRWPFCREYFDVVVSGQCMEHVKDLYRWIQECRRVLKPGGLICLIAPWKFKVHQHPVDCWRILPDGMTFLMRDIGRFSLLECCISDVNTIGIGRKS